ncbi:enteropeptidase-like [Embiotoca jacksoni]|uniref:enteropeptidase-like n=1 Tax=Embiotoca jacksoni TaxID=100190 RepID=UPI0037049573
MKRHMSSLEFFLSVISSLLLICCAALIIVSWISLKPDGAVEPVQLTGRMVITNGAVFSRELMNSSSPQFKSLAYDVQMLVSEAFSLSELRRLYKSCQVQYFRHGSVAVSFDLWFHQLVDVKEVEQQLWAGIQEAPGRGLMIDRKSLQIGGECEVTVRSPKEVNIQRLVICPPQQAFCADGTKCVRISRLCDGVNDCPDASDEAAAHCATACDGQFVLSGSSGSFSSSKSDMYHNSSFCRWIIRVDRGLSVQVSFDQFETELNLVTLSLFEGVGPNKVLTAELSGSTPPTMWLFTDQSTLEFISYDINSLSGFTATYSAANISSLSDEEKLTCTFEQGMCFWRDYDWTGGHWSRISGPTFPPSTGPSVDHTLGNSSGFYIVTPISPGQFLKSFKIYSLPLTPPTRPMCLRFWYHMFGNNVRQLRVFLQSSPWQPSLNDTIVFQRDGNYGDNWNYGQVTLNLTSESRVVFEALKKGGMMNNIALDDITLTSDPCGPAPPELTNVPSMTTVAPSPTGCGGPFDLWEPNSTFTSPNYPLPYGDENICLWILNTVVGQNIQLHFLDFHTELAYDVVEVRDGAGPNSTLLAILSSDGPTHDLFSTTNQMTVWFITDKSNSYPGFKANFTSGVRLGLPAPCAVGQFQCKTGSCINGNTQCDGTVNCPDASDEANCIVLQVQGLRRLKFRLASSLLTVCADSWSSHQSNPTCRYLGYRFGEASRLPALPQDSPFANITVTSNGTLEAVVSQTCQSEEVIALNCSNKPCGVQIFNHVTRGNRVVGGTNAVKGAWPWMVSLEWGGNPICGASLIGKDWLLTAAHCVYGMNVHIQDWTAVLGLHSRSNRYEASVQIREIDRVIIHRDYNRRTKQADIAMMHLQQPVDFTQWVQPVCLPARGQNFAIGRICYIAGWGRDAEDGVRPDILQQARVPLVSRTLCQSQILKYNITSSKLCAGYPVGGVDSCKGDSGGPLMCLDNGHWTAIGVISFGLGCGRPQTPGVYARVAAFTSWIARARRSHPSSSPFL